MTVTKKRRSKVFGLHQSSHSHANFEQIAMSLVGNTIFDLGPKERLRAFQTLAKLESKRHRKARYCSAHRSSWSRDSSVVALGNRHRAERGSQIPTLIILVVFATCFVLPLAIQRFFLPYVFKIKVAW